MGKPRLKRGFFLLRCHKSHSTELASNGPPRKKKPRIPRWLMQGFSVPLWGNLRDVSRHARSRRPERGSNEAKGGRESGEPQPRGRAGALRFLWGEPVARGEDDRVTGQYVRAFKRYSTSGRLKGARSGRNAGLIWGEHLADLAAKSYRQELMCTVSHGDCYC